MRQHPIIREQFRRGNAPLILIAAPQPPAAVRDSVRSGPDSSLIWYPPSRAGLNRTTAETHVVELPVDALSSRAE
jgi:hypothetical protein